MSLLLLMLLIGQDKEIKPEMEWQGEESKIQVAEIERIVTKEAWAKLWQRHAGKDAKVPEVDFEKSMVVTIFRGNTPPKGLYATFTIKESKDALTVSYIYDKPGAQFYQLVNAR